MILNVVLLKIPNTGLNTSSICHAPEFVPNYQHIINKMSQSQDTHTRELPEFPKRIVDYESKWDDELLVTAGDVMSQDNNDWADHVEARLSELLDAAKDIHIPGTQYVSLIWKFSNYPDRPIVPPEPETDDNKPYFDYDDAWEE